MIGKYSERLGNVWCRVDYLLVHSPGHSKKTQEEMETVCTSGSEGRNLRGVTSLEIIFER
jgi:hypothetical protein